MGASERDIQRGTILIFGLNILNFKGSHEKGTKREENPYLFDVKLMTLWQKSSPKNTSKPPECKLHSNYNLP